MNDLPVAVAFEVGLDYDVAKIILRDPDYACQVIGQAMCMYLKIPTDAAFQVSFVDTEHLTLWVEGHEVENKEACGQYLRGTVNAILVSLILREPVGFPA